MDYHIEDTICAIATAAGGSLRGIVRVSGPETIDCLSRCFAASDGTDLANVRVAQVIRGHVQLESLSAAIACDLFLWPTKRSYTRQPAAELHTVGSPPLLDAAVKAICSCGARVAEPGEFTLRAFLAGRLDLTQVEAVLGIVDAEDQAALDVALTQLAGGLADPLKQLRADLLELLSHLEAGLDFADEEIDFISRQQLAGNLDQAMRCVNRLLTHLDSRGHSVSAFRIVLRGWPNAGKSSLMNALVDRSISIVSSQPGTTRDYVVRRVEWEGVPCLFIDTAGVNEQTALGSVDAEAQDVANQQVYEADLELLCIDATRRLNDWETCEVEKPVPSQRLIVLTKVDLVASEATVLTSIGIPTSSQTGQGIARLRSEICRHLGESRKGQDGTVGSRAIGSRVGLIRCGESLRTARDSLQRAQVLVAQAGGDELVAVEVRDALDHLGRIVGAVYTDEILDHIFGQFCIGK